MASSNDLPNISSNFISLEAVHSVGTRKHVHKIMNITVHLDPPKEKGHFSP